VVAAELLDAATRAERVTARALDEALAEEAAGDLAAGRPFDPSLGEPASRRDRLADTLRWALRQGLARRDGPAAVAVDAGRVLGDSRVLRLAREHASRRALPPTPPEPTRPDGS
jgi:hypothetical protein